MGFIISKRILKRILGYITDDMICIPQYVALLSYLYNYLGEDQSAANCVRHYQSELNIFMNEKLKNTHVSFRVTTILCLRLQIAAVLLWKIGSLCDTMDINIKHIACQVGNFIFFALSLHEGKAS